MKRTSPWLVLLVLAPGIADATDYVPPRYRVHYSPYSFSYRNSGLVPGGLDYSMQAFSYRHSGLVSEGVRYTPYLLRYGSTGLVIDYYRYSTPSARYGPACESSRVRAPIPCPRGASPRVCAAGEPPAPAAKQRTNEIETIRQHLQAKGHDVNVNRILRIGGNLVSVDFFLKDRNLIIKYWNPTQIESLKTQEKFKQTAFERYRQNWMEIAAQHEQSGGRIHYVEASDTQTILAALDSCTELDVNPETANEAIMYAKN
jgi:hypothetical protein